VNDIKKFRSPTSYPFEQLGAMYVHTSYTSFYSNVVSFGEHTSTMESLAHSLIKTQEDREERISQMMVAAFGVTIDQYVQWHKDFFRHYEEAVKQTILTPGKTNIQILKSAPSTSGKGSINITSITQAVGKDIQLAFELMQQRVNEVVLGLNQLLDKGYGNKTNIEEHIKILQDHLANVKGKATNEEGEFVNKLVHADLTYLLGKLEEGLVPIVKAGILGDTKDGFKFALELVGGVNKPGADTMASFKYLADVFSYGINVKKTRVETFKDTGVYLYSPTSVSNLIDHMVGFLGHTPAIEAFKYYLINSSRTSGRALRHGEGKTGLGAVEEGQNLIHKILQTYTTLFIGEQDSRPGLSEEFRQADFLVLGDAIFKKSDVLKQVLGGEKYTKGMSVLLDFTSNTSVDWEAFDNRKVELMNQYKGKYDVVGKHPFMKSPVEAMLARGVRIKLAGLKGLKL